MEGMIISIDKSGHGLKAMGYVNVDDLNSLAEKMKEKMYSKNKGLVTPSARLSRQASRQKRHTPSNMSRQALACCNKQLLPQAYPLFSFPQQARALCCFSRRLMIIYIYIMFWGFRYVR